MTATADTIRAELLRKACRMGLDAFITRDTLRVCDHRGAWVTVASDYQLCRIKHAVTAHRQTPAWMTRKTNHHYARG